jgi:hypothetical protein
VFSLDEDRLSKRKSIGETISLQVEVESRNSPEKEEVRRNTNTCTPKMSPVSSVPHSLSFYRGLQQRRSHLKL